MIEMIIVTNNDFENNDRIKIGYIYIDMYIYVYMYGKYYVTYAYSIYHIVYHL